MINIQQQQSLVFQDSFNESKESSKEPSILYEKMLKELNLPLEYPDYSSLDYWNSRYARSVGQVFEWMQPYSALRPHVHKLLHDRFETSQVLYAGCGNSQLGELIYQEGIANIKCIDFSDALLRNMAPSPIPYMLMDATQSLDFEDNQFDLIIDKGLLDSIMCGEQFFERCKVYLSECRRVLKKKGTLMILSYGHPDTRLIYLKHFSVNVQEIKKLKIDQFDDGDFHFLYICTNH